MENIIILKFFGNIKNEKQKEAKKNYGNGKIYGAKHKLNKKTINCLPAVSSVIYRKKARKRTLLKIV